MKVILIKDVKKIGQRFEEREVSDGYAINFLLPQGLAVVADSRGRAQVQKLKSKSENKRQVEEREKRDKEAKRLEKHLELERFRQGQRREPSS